ncbi:uncharacterized protein LAESUDRAFT_764031 [Laetiporus sulphureus 93-53]|uniref:Uncharacterized protein n=1 Tax=Laetiporus sulphureus 93-53 TaxID=1314785 RepID=A0A165BI62_9APHY|nr:uncharacterized protein LAESUDRAFT_764031 [Laetiporus sulphureus 93-53]KZT01105.1 hypothetical protein LAESUDRAFT_764031 [Laetiporus sulphureus 93-53]
MFFELDDMSQMKVSIDDLDEGLPQKPGLVPNCGPLMIMMDIAKTFDFFEPIDEAITIFLDNISDYPASFSALMLPFLDVVAEVANHVLVNERKLELHDVSADGLELEYEMLEVEDVVVIKLTTISFGE